MSYRTNQTITFGSRLWDKMRIRRVKLYLNFGACLLVFVYGWGHSASPQAVMATIGFIQGVNIPEVIEAYNETRTQPTFEQVEKPPKQR